MTLPTHDGIVADNEARLGSMPQHLRRAKRDDNVLKSHACIEHLPGPHAKARQPAVGRTFEMRPS